MTASLRDSEIGTGFVAASEHTYHEADGIVGLCNGLCSRDACGGHRASECGLIRFAATAVFLAGWQCSYTTFIFSFDRDRASPGRSVRLRD